MPCGLARALLFFGQSAPWKIVGLRRVDRALIALNAGYTAVNLVGIWRWLI